jgi:hypothetical protein
MHTHNLKHRANCALSSLHCLITQDEGYAIEDKWTFLEKAKQCNIPVTPTLNAGKIVVKHRNEEGGLGYQSFLNACAGGDWIVQVCVCVCVSVQQIDTCAEDGTFAQKQTHKVTQNHCKQTKKHKDTEN